MFAGYVLLLEPVAAELAPPPTDPREPGGGAVPAVFVEVGGGRTGNDAVGGNNTWLHSYILEPSIPCLIAFDHSCIYLNLDLFVELYLWRY